MSTYDNTIDPIIIIIANTKCVVDCCQATQLAGCSCRRPSKIMLTLGEIARDLDGLKGMQCLSAL